LGAAVPAGPDSVFPLTPKYSASGGLEYRLPVDESFGSFSGRVDISYQSKTSPDTNPFRADSATGALLPESEELDARTIVNLRLTYTSPGGKYELAGYVTNLFDELYRVAAVDFNTGFGFEQFGAPRQLGVALKVNF
jgi:outer membrane receptor protein involved in Fe transport